MTSLFADSIIFSFTNKGKPRLWVNGYEFIKDYERFSRTFWRCRFQYKSCKCRCVTKDGQLVVKSSTGRYFKEPHNHWLQLISIFFFNTVQCKNL